MNHEPTTRKPPEIIFVPPPRGPGMPSRRIWNIVGACAIGGGICFLLILSQRGPLWLFFAFMIPLLLVVTIIVAITAWRRNKAYQAQRQRFLEHRPGGETDTLTIALQQTWNEYDRIPKIKDVRVTLESTGNNRQPDRALIVCFGEPDAPTIGEFYFEPEIIPYTEAIWRQLIWPVIAGILLIWFLLDYAGALPTWLPPTRSLLSGFAYFLVAGATIMAVWMWKCMIRPTYVRMAPGIIQFLEYRSSKSKPDIRAYPMESGTLAVLTRIRKKLYLTLSRGSHKDALAFAMMRQPQQWIDRTWRALLSTAPTPPLSEDELVG